MALLSVPQGLGQIISLLQGSGVQLMSPLVDFVAPATAISYAPTTPTDWNPRNPTPVPTTVQEALDILIGLTNSKFSAVLGSTLGAGAGNITWAAESKWIVGYGTGPGGGGGGALTNGGSGIVAAAGGGSGGATFFFIAPRAMFPVGTTPYVVGTAGAGGAAGANGNNGSAATTIGSGPFYSAGPGQGGTGINSTSAVSNTGTASGANATGGLLNLPGGGGEGGSAEGNTPATACWGTSGRGGATFWGPGGVSRRQNQQSLTTDFDQAGNNAPAGVPGSGGGGALCFTSTTGAAGGNGNDGRIVYWEFV